LEARVSERPCARYVDETRACTQTCVRIQTQTRVEDASAE